MYRRGDEIECRNNFYNFFCIRLPISGINCDQARSEEERIMLEDAKEWLATKSSLVNQSHPKDGATPLHVACAKGYTDVLK